MTDLRQTYTSRYNDVLKPLAERLQSFIIDQLGNTQRIDRISARAKSIERFVAKAEKTVDGEAKYSDPLNEIQDQIGARIVTFYLSDVDEVARVVKQYFRAIEDKYIVPDSEKEFDYVGKHFILFVPSDVLDDTITKEIAPKVFELQIKTLFQHAWSEANHDLGYKPNSELTSHQKRRIAFTSAQAWGADQIFDELHGETCETTVSA
jgi:putative GTP pyrophosphokinase